MRHRACKRGSGGQPGARRLVALAITLAFGLLLVGCGDSSDQVSPERTSAKATRAAASAATATAEATRPTGYLGQRGIYAAFPPADPDLYRRLLPPQFEMPNQPQVSVFVVDYYDINLPLPDLYPDLGLPAMVPYREGAILLRSIYEGRAGWHVITMPVDDQTANDAGRLMGFPKYVADEITLEEEGGGWTGRVLHEGRTMLAMSFTPAPGAETEEKTGGSNAALFQLVPPGEGPTVSTVHFVSSDEVQTRSLAGTATIQVDPEAEWAGLIPEGGVGAMFRETTGVSNLVSSVFE